MPLTKYKLPSGAEMEVDDAPFSDAKSLYQALASEAKRLKLDAKAEVDVNFFKDMLCHALDSELIEERVWKCMERATYAGKRITKETFEPINARQDYLTVCFKVLEQNVSPFLKSLYAQYADRLRVLIKSQA